MGIALTQMERGSALRRSSFIMALCVSATAAATAYLNAGSVNGLVAGSTVTITSQYTRQPTSLFVTPAHAGITVVYRITGENQFGDVIREDISVAGTTAAHTLNCFRRITALSIVSVTGGTLGAGTTISIGHSNAAGCRFPLWSRTIPAAAVKALVYAGNSPTVASSISVDTTRSCVVDAGAATVSTEAQVYLDPQYERYI